MKINIAIIGLGRVGSILFQELLENKNRGITIIMVAELDETPGKLLARNQNIKIGSVEEVISFGEKIDLIFELTGNMDVRRNLRSSLKTQNNNHTVVVTETVASLICRLLSHKDLPDLHKHSGY